MLEVEILRRTLNRERKARKAAEFILEQKSAELYQSHKQLTLLNNHLGTEIDKRTKQLNDLFKNMYDAVWISNEQGTIIDANPAGRRLLGLNEVEKIAINILDITYEDDLEKLNACYINLKKTGRCNKYQGRIWTRNKEIKFIEVNSTAVYEEDRFMGSRDIIRDISAQKALEDKRERLLKELSRVNNDLNDFAHVVSHDLKAPLRAIGALIEWIYEDYYDKFDLEGKRNMELILTSVGRMNELIRGILAYSSIGNTNEIKKLVNLKSVVKDTIDLLACPPHIEIKITGEYPLFWMNQIRIQQVFQNLLSNAIRYSNKTEGLIEIHGKEQESDWLFYVKDNGQGIKSKHFKKIFQIFQTLSAKEVKGSTGIGLTIVKKIIDWYEGQIWIDSKIDIGTTFYFSFSKDYMKLSEPEPHNENQDLQN